MVSKLGIQYLNLETVWVKNILLDVKWFIRIYRLDRLECFVGLVEAEAPWAETKVSWVRARALPCKIRVPGLAFDRIHRLRISMCSVNSATHGYTAPSIYSKMTHIWDSPPSGKHEDYYMGWLNYHPSLSCTRQGVLHGG